MLVQKKSVATVVSWLLLLLIFQCQQQQQQQWCHAADEDDEVILPDEEQEYHPPELYDADEVWSSWTVRGVYWWLQCKETYHSVGHPESFPVHNASTWQLLRQAYRDTVGAKESSLPPPEDDEGGAPTGFQVPVQVIQTDDLGRGIFAGQEIPAGTLVWTSKYTARFTTGAQYRSFLRRIPPALACDVVEWAYTRWTTTTTTATTTATATATATTPPGTTTTNAAAVVCVDLDNGSFTNGCDTDDAKNMDVGKQFHNTGCELAFYATRDIPAGEQLIIDYTFSAMLPGWIDMGLEAPDDEGSYDYYYHGHDNDKDREEGGFEYYQEGEL